MSILVSPHELRDKIYHGDKTTILASLWAPGEGESFNQFSSLHVPTAQYADAASAFVGLPGSKVGRNPLPLPEKVQEWVDHWGLCEGYEVVVYDEGRGLFAGRAWWTLRWAGVQNVRILDGGLSNWRAQGMPTLTGPGNLGMTSDITVQPGSMPTVTIDEVKEHTGLLLDARTRNRFAGRRENLDLKAGHIPGAVNLPERLFHTDGVTVWRSKEEIIDILGEHGVTKENTDGAIIYSGSGNHSSLAIALLEYVGFTGLRHFVGGWSQWSANPKNPVERGDRDHV